MGLIYKDHCPQKSPYESYTDHWQVYVTISGNTCPKATVVSDLGDSMIIAMAMLRRQVHIPQKRARHFSAV